MTQVVKSESQESEKAKAYIVSSGCEHLDTPPHTGFSRSLPKTVSPLFHKICFTLWACSMLLFHWLFLFYLYISSFHNSPQISLNLKVIKSLESFPLAFLHPQMRSEYFVKSGLSHCSHGGFAHPLQQPPGQSSALQCCFKLSFLPGRTGHGSATSLPGHLRLAVSYGIFLPNSFFKQVRTIILFLWT